jgi:hypothetical protein
MVDMVGIGAVMGDRLEQVVQFHGLAEIGGERETPGLALPFRETGETHYGKVRDPRIGQLEPAELRPVHPGHLQVEDDEAGTFAASKELEGVVPVPRGQRAIARFLDYLVENREELAVVVDDENRFARLDCPGGHWRNRIPRNVAGTGPADLHPPPNYG